MLWSSVASGGVGVDVAKGGKGAKPGLPVPGPRGEGASADHGESEGVEEGGDPGRRPEHLRHHRGAPQPRHHGDAGARGLRA